MVTNPYPNTYFQNYDLSGTTPPLLAPSTFSPGGTNSWSNNVSTNNNSNNNSQSGAASNPFTATQDLIKNIGPTAAKQTGIGSGITSAINNAGMSLGFGSGGGASEAISPALAAADPSLAEAGASVAEGATSAGSLTGASLSSVLGAGAIGAFGGGLLAGALGENTVGGSIGGGLGAAAGMAFGGAALSSLGLELGAFGGPVGAIAGGAIGAVVGGLFGNQTPATNADTYQTTIANPLTGSEQSKNPGATAGSQQAPAVQFSNLANQAATDLGIKFNPNMGIVTTVSTRHPGPEGDSAIQVDYHGLNSNDGAGSGLLFYNPSDPASIQAAQYKALTMAANEAGYTDDDTLHDWFFKTGDYAPKATTPSTITIAPKK